MLPSVLQTGVDAHKVRWKCFYLWVEFSVKVIVVMLTHALGRKRRTTGEIKRRTYFKRYTNVKMSRLVILSRGDEDFGSLGTIPAVCTGGTGLLWLQAVKTEVWSHSFSSPSPERPLSCTPSALKGLFWWDYIWIYSSAVGAMLNDMFHFTYLPSITVFSHYIQVVRWISEQRRLPLTSELAHLH